MRSSVLIFDVFSLFRQVLGWCLAPEIVKYLDSAVNNFRKVSSTSNTTQRHPENSEAVITVDITATVLLTFWQRWYLTTQNVHPYTVPRTRVCYNSFILFILVILKSETVLDVSSN